MDLTLALDALREIVVSKYEFYHLDQGKRNSLIQLGLALTKAIGHDAESTRLEFRAEELLNQNRRSRPRDETNWRYWPKD